MVEQIVVAELVIVAVCVLLSAFFSSSETALTALSEREARQLLDTNPKRYGALKLWVDYPNRVLTTILIGNNVVNIFAAALATTIAERMIKNQAVAVATGVMTFLVLVFGEITPKTFAKHNYLRLAPISMRILRLCYLLFFPATVVLTEFSKMLVRFVGQKVTRTGPFVTQEDIAYLIDLGTREGTIDEDEEQLLHSVIEFGDTLVREIMIPRTEMIAVEVDISREELSKMVAEAGHSRIPIFDETIDNIMGVFFAKDLIKSQHEGDTAFRLASHLHKPYFVPEVMRISDLLKEFQRRKTHIAIVVDEYGGTSGIVTLEDVLEEIVGEIQDEYDAEERQFQVLPNGKMVAEGRISVHDLGENIGVELPESDAYETLGGFLTMRAGRLPEKGTTIHWNGFDFHIKDADERRVSWIEIERVGQPFEETDEEKAAG